LDRALKLTGFRIDDHTALHERARDDLMAWVRAGAVRQWETVTEGLEGAPAAFAAMLQGRGKGKHLVKLS
jgi:NADPH-dependent curcumin reductase CurA